MKITRDEAKRIADLAHLAFDDAALDRMASEMTKILTYIDQLAEVELEANVGQASDCPTPLRDDTIASQPADPARNAPEWDNGYFVVPKVIGE
ncbi:MAG: Asp-tRNA(Asn)/Glu-tRNA(Gln) amidotransferase subunit GatC [Acidobacteriota bacterium]